MIEQLPSDAAHVVAFRANGRVNVDDLQQAIDALEKVKKEQPRVSIYTEIDDMRWMTATSVVRYLGYGLTQLGDLKHFHRAAVITERQWARPIAQLETTLLRPLEVRVFTPREREAAKEWVRHLPERPEATANEATG